MQLLPSCLSALLSEKQIEELAGQMDQISADWNSQTIWRTWTEANCSVLNDLKFPTSAAKYHQAKKEKLVSCNYVYSRDFWLLGFHRA